MKVPSQIIFTNPLVGGIQQTNLIKFRLLFRKKKLFIS